MIIYLSTLYRMDFILRYYFMKVNDDCEHHLGYGRSVAIASVFSYGKADGSTQ